MIEVSLTQEQFKALKEVVEEADHLDVIEPAMTKQLIHAFEYASSPKTHSETENKKRGPQD